MSTTFPPLEPGRHGWAELLSLVGAVRRLARDVLRIRLELWRLSVTNGGIVIHLRRLSAAA